MVFDLYFYCVTSVKPAFYIVMTVMCILLLIWLQAVFTLVARALVTGHRRKMVLCSNTGFARYVDMFTFNKSSTCPLHLKCVSRIMHAFRVNSYLLDYCFLRFLYLFHVVFLYETLRRLNGLRRLATISADCHGNLCRHFKKIGMNVFLTDPHWQKSSWRERKLGKSHVFRMFLTTNSFTFLIENGWKVIVSLKICLNSWWVICTAFSDR